MYPSNRARKPGGSIIAASSSDGAPSAHCDRVREGPRRFFGLWLLVAKVVWAPPGLENSGSQCHPCSHYTPWSTSAGYGSRAGPELWLGRTSAVERRLRHAGADMSHKRLRLRPRSKGASRCQVCVRRSRRGRAGPAHRTKGQRRYLGRVETQLLGFPARRALSSGGRYPRWHRPPSPLMPQSRGWGEVSLRCRRMRTRHQPAIIARLRHDRSQGYARSEVTRPLYGLLLRTALPGCPAFSESCAVSASTPSDHAVRALGRHRGQPVIPEEAAQEVARRHRQSA